MQQPDACTEPYHMPNTICLEPSPEDEHWGMGDIAGVLAQIKS
jgi:hypothetical protein